MTLEVTQMSSLLHNKQITAQVNGDAEVIVNGQMATWVLVQLTTMPTVSSFCKTAARICQRYKIPPHLDANATNSVQLKR